MGEENENYSVKKELKDEGTHAIKDVILSGINSLGNLGRGAIKVFTKHPKVESLKEDVEEHIEEIKEGDNE